MHPFFSPKKRKLLSVEEIEERSNRTGNPPNGDDDTDLKIATLASLFPLVDSSVLLEMLILADGSMEVASQRLEIFKEDERARETLPSMSPKGVGYQSSLSSYKNFLPARSGKNSPSTILTKKGKILHLYSPEDVAAHTPCSIIHNFLSADQAERLLRELLKEAPTFERQTFKVFDNVVQSPHSACFYVESLEERRKQQTEYLYNGSYLTVSGSYPVMS